MYGGVAHQADFKKGFFNHLYSGCNSGGMFMQVVSHSPPPTHANTSYTKSNINNVHFTPEYLIIDQVAYVILARLTRWVDESVSGWMRA